MQEDDVIRIMREHLEGLFPKARGNCGRRFETLREYLMVTEHRGSAMPYDADLGDWEPVNHWERLHTRVALVATRWHLVRGACRFHNYGHY